MIVSSLSSRSSPWLPINSLDQAPNSIPWINARDDPNIEKELLPKPAAITSCVPLPPINSVTFALPITDKLPHVCQGEAGTAAAAPS